MYLKYSNIWFELGNNSSLDCSFSITALYFATIMYVLIPFIVTASSCEAVWTSFLYNNLDLKPFFLTELTSSHHKYSKDIS